MKPLFILIFLAISTITNGQSFEVSYLISEQTKNGTLTGIILDNETSNEPLAFATVEVKGTSTSTSTAIDGTFSIKLRPGTYTIIYSFIGYKTVEVNNVKVIAYKQLHFNQSLSALTPEIPVLISQLK